LVIIQIYFTLNEIDPTKKEHFASMINLYLISAFCIRCVAL
jgi:hypothetical protein